MACATTEHIAAQRQGRARRHQVRPNNRPKPPAAGALCQPITWRNPLIELTLKVKLTARQLCGIARLITLVAVILT